MRIKLISPARKAEWGESFWDLKNLCKLTGRKAGGAPLALPTLAALTPKDIEVTLTDENISPINFEEKLDLVGITGMTCVIPRAYEIADEFRKRGITVVMGGIHVSMLPEEAIQHCDSVIIGEAEEVWGQVLNDAKKNNLQKFYKADGFPDLTNSPVPRWDLLDNEKYCYFTIQTGRGCPYDCEFCTVKVFNGREYRHKKIEQVLAEVKTLLKIDHKKLIFFTDDNLLAVPNYAEELLKKLIPLNIKNWMCQSSINRLKNDHLLDLMYQAGCRVIFVGFESVSQNSLDAMNKGLVNRVNEYKEIINKVHSHKIAVFGSFVLGSDSDDQMIFKNTVDFIESTSIAFSMINCLTLLPGSNIYERLKKEGRISGCEWWKSNADWVCYEPKLISKQALGEGHHWVLKQIYSYKNLSTRLKTLFDLNIFTRSKNKNRLSLTRIIFSIYAFLSFDFSKIKFMFSALWNKKCTSIMWILTAVNYHNYAYSLKKKNYV